jgi:uncharacterized protein
VTRRIELVWADRRPFVARKGRPIRILASSDEIDPALDHDVNRTALGAIDLIVGCGDLSPERVAFLGDAFRTTVVYVRGNHDHGGPWRAASDVPLEAHGVDECSLPGVNLLGLGWPGLAGPDPARRDEVAAWRQVVGVLKVRLVLPPNRPWLVFSHAPPRDAGDTPDDPYHVGFAAYRTVLEHLRPRLWLHGHTTRASQRTPIVEHGPTTLINVTGSFLVELVPPPMP